MRHAVGIAHVRYETVHGSVPTVLRFRVPGCHFSAACHRTLYRVTFPSCRRLEVHVGIRVIGKSRILHECDITAVLYHIDEAELCRQEQVYLGLLRSPYLRMQILHVELSNCTSRVAFLG